MQFKITYDKVFTSGYLANVNLPSAFTVPESSLSDTLQKLRALEVRRTIKKDMFSKETYFICNVRAVKL